MSPTEIRVLEEESGEEIIYLPVDHIDTPKYVKPPNKLNSGKASMTTATSHKTIGKPNQY